MELSFSLSSSIKHDRYYRDSIMRVSDYGRFAFVTAVKLMASKVTNGRSDGGRRRPNRDCFRGSRKNDSVCDINLSVFV